MSGMFRTMAAGAAVSMIAAAMVGATSAASAEERLAPVEIARKNGVPNKYVVMLKEDTLRSDGARIAAVRETSDAVAAQGAEVVDRFETVGGYSAIMNAEQLAAARKDQRVERIYQARELQVMSEPATEVAAAQSPAGASLAPRNVPNWGLDRIDQPNLPLDDRYNPPGNGNGTHIYFVDSGVNFNHQEFRGIRTGLSTSVNDKVPSPTDCLGHGTHVAGIAGGATRGVVRGATLHSVRVLDCKGRGDDSLVMKAADWIIANGEKPAVVNMSVGVEMEPGETSPADPAVEKLYDAGYLSSIAAGNSEKDACTFAPARTPKGFTVANLNGKDGLDMFSNWGNCIDAFAPGEYINSADHKGGGYKDESGTSMAAPHVAGAAAMFLSRYPYATPGQVTDAILRVTARDKIKNPKSPNRLLQVVGLLNNGPTDPGPQPTTPQPTKPVPTTPQPTTPVPTTPQPTTPQPTTPQPSNPGTTNPVPNPGNVFEDRQPQPVNDYQTAKSTIQSSFASGKKVTVTINMDHPCLENLEIAITTPDGVRNVVKRSSASRQCTAWRGEKSETYDMRSATNGSWTLEVTDNTRGNSGTLNGWKVSFS